ncbi:MAG: biopolymer transporter ExbD [Sandaracinaceae bacterium]|nr:biopolymer transporter ExbD [Sandaracinaceae bacterium]
MASISTGSEGGGRKTVDSEIPLVPFIDLLLCCVMFLLVTAVWNQLAAVEASTPNLGSDDRRTTADTPVDARPVYLELTRGDVGVVFPDGTSARVTLEQLPIVLQHVDSADVIEMLPDDDVSHGEVVQVLSGLRGAGHPRVRLLVHPSQT